MPELPEVETTLRGIMPHVQGQRVVKTIVRDARLRYPVAPDLAARLVHQRFEGGQRRGKYLLLDIGGGQLMIHLGMSGSLRLVPEEQIAGKHDHLDLVLSSGLALRFTDPRRFGLVLWLPADSEVHPLLKHLGPEPLEQGDNGFSGEYLYQRSRKKSAPVKSFIMDSKVVVGVGNIYANEALFIAGIHPLRAAGKISRDRYQRLGAAIRQVLMDAIAQGGTTLRDFVGGDGKPGYFSQSLRVYGRAGEPCVQCGTTLQEVRLGQRSCVYCKRCQR